MPYTKNGYCVGALGTMTAALGATRALAKHGIFAEVIGLAANETRRGCAYGVCFACAALDRVRGILKADGISVSEYLQRGQAP